MIALFRDAPSPSKPGEVWNYNNSGYILLGAIIEMVTGMPWHQAVEARTGIHDALHRHKPGVLKTPIGLRLACFVIAAND